MPARQAVAATYLVNLYIHNSCTVADLQSGVLNRTPGSIKKIVKPGHQASIWPERQSALS